MACADTNSYEQMIQALQQFLSGLQEQCSGMSAAATDCVDNMEGDPAAATSAGKVNECVSKISSNFESIQSIISGLQQELEDIIEAARAAEG